MSAAVKRSAWTGSAPIFAALGDETRLRLVARLCSDGPLSIARLTDDHESTRQAITKHLRVLADAGLVRGVREGRESRWELEPRRLEEMRGFLEQISARWTQRLESLERHLDSMPDEPAGKRGGRARKDRR